MLFFNQGATLKVFSIPREFSDEFLKKCPPDFKFGTFHQSGTPIRDARVDEDLPACIFNKESTNRQDVVVVADQKLFYQRIDR